MHGSIKFNAETRYSTGRHFCTGNTERDASHIPINGIIVN
jgi:hypothetical protein